MSSQPSCCCANIGWSTGQLIIEVLALALLLNCQRILLVLIDGPVEYVVVLETLAHEQVTEDLAEVRVVRLIIETKGTGVVEIDGELVGKAAAQNLGRGGHFLFHNSIILLFLSSSLESLPWKRAPAEIEHHVAKRFHIIATGLLNAKMSIDAGISSGSGQVFVLAVRNVEVSLRVTVLLSQAEVDDVDLISSFANPHQEVVWLDVAVDERLGVNVLDTRD